MAGGLGKRTVLQAGYGAVIAVLVVSAFEAYRIQISLSEQHREIYRHYVDQEQALATLRRNLWLAGNDVRDFFIRTTPGQAETLRAQLNALQAEDGQALAFLAGLPGQRDIVRKMRKSRGEFWNLVDVLPRTMLAVPHEKQFEFLQSEIVPLRGQLYNALLDLSTADQQRLQGSEREFADTRRHAAVRLLIMLGLGVLLSFVVARISLHHAESLERKAERHHADVEQARAELQQLSARLLEIEEEGRRRLSRELHDEIGQTLALLQIQISHAQAALGGSALSSCAAVLEPLSHARELTERTVQTIHNIAVLLRPALLDDLGLVPALQFQLEDFLRRSGIVCDFAEEGVADRLPDAVKTCVYRVVQEALHNCEKHSGATRVRVTVRQFPEFLTAEIEDNGCGFRLNEQHMPSKSRGLGFLGIRERAAIAGGSLVVDSAPGHGTRIALRIPLAPETVMPREVSA
jgi:signal transduction histidine kinase